MGKKNKKKNNQTQKVAPVQNSAEIESNVEQVAVETQNSAETVVNENKIAKESEKVVNKDNSKKKKVKKEKKPSKIARKSKETISELKKVSWPTFKETVKRTGVVLGIVIFFGIILFAFDYVLTVLSSLLAGKTISAVQQWVSIGIAIAFVVAAVVCAIVWAVKKKNRNRR